MDRSEAPTVLVGEGQGVRAKFATSIPIEDAQILTATQGTLQCGETVHLDQR